MDRVDRKTSALHSKIIHDFLKYISLNRDVNTIYWDFVCRERDNLVHEFSLQAEEMSVTSRPFLVDTNLTYQELVQKYGQRKIIIWGEDGEDGLRLLEVALQWWEGNLRVLEHALRTADENPFSLGWRHREELLGHSLKYIPLFNYDWEQGSIAPPSLPPVDLG